MSWRLWLTYVAFVADQDVIIRLYAYDEVQPCLIIFLP